MKKIETKLPEVYMIEPDVYEDARGFFLESWNEETYRSTDMPNCHFVQHNHSRSNRGVLRGLHYQLHHPQAKLIQVAQGSDAIRQLQGQIDQILAEDFDLPRE